MPSVFTAKEPALAPVATPPRYSLLVAATKLDDGLRWEQGIRWAPEQNAGGGIAAVDCTGSTAALNVGTNLGFAVADPYAVWAEDHCSTLGSQSRDFEARALRQLEATQSYRIAKELWSGAVAQVAPLDNEWLTHDPEVLSTGTGLSPAVAVGLADQGLGQMLAGQRGMIHVSPNVLDEIQLNAGGGLTKSGDLWTTPMGNVVVADAGYPGTHPDGSSSTNQWIYATPWIYYRLGDVFTTPDNLDAARAQAVDRSVNLLTFRAQRLVLLEWTTTIPVGNHSHKPVLAVETNVAAFAFAA